MSRFLLGEMVVSVQRPSWQMDSIYRQCYISNHTRITDLMLVSMERYSYILARRVDIEVQSNFAASLIDGLRKFLEKLPYHFSSIKIKQRVSGR